MGKRKCRAEQYWDAPQIRGLDKCPAVAVVVSAFSKR